MLLLGLRGESPLIPFLGSIKTYFGLTSNHQQNLLKEILFLVGRGFTYSDILIMPTYMRKYFISYLVPKE
jgi:hypothetical protein